MFAGYEYAQHQMPMNRHRQCHRHIHKHRFGHGYGHGCGHGHGQTQNLPCFGRRSMNPWTRHSLRRRFGMKQFNTFDRFRMFDKFRRHDRYNEFERFNHRIGCEKWNRWNRWNQWNQMNQMNQMNQWNPFQMQFWGQRCSPMQWMQQNCNYRSNNGYKSPQNWREMHTGMRHPNFHFHKHRSSFC